MSSTSAMPLPPLWRLSPESPTTLRRNLLICALVSVLIHAGIVWVGRARAHAGSVVAPVQPPVVVMITMPKPEPDPVEVTNDPTERASLPADFAPSLQEIPPTGSKPIFIQPPEPYMPPVEGHSTQIRIPAYTGLGGSSVAIYTPGMLDKQPVPVVQGKPAYPFELRQAGITGQAVVDFIVDRTGNVRNARVESATSNAFGSSAVAAVSKWHFRAGMKGGKTVNTRMQAPIVFNLNDKE